MQPCHFDEALNSERPKGQDTPKGFFRLSGVAARMQVPLNRVPSARGASCLPAFSSEAKPTRPDRCWPIVLRIRVGVWSRVVGCARQVNVLSCLSLSCICVCVVRLSCTPSLPMSMLAPLFHPFVLPALPILCTCTHIHGTLNQTLSV